MKIIWSVNAKNHLLEIISYITKDNISAAQSVKDQINTVVSRLSQSPMLGKPGRVEKTREIVVPRYSNYIIVYEISNQTINILAVRHSARKWPDSF